MIKIFGIFLFLLLTFPIHANELPTIAVVDFSTSVHTHAGRGLKSKLPDIITDKLVNSGYFDVLEREKLSSVMREIGFQGGGFVSQDNVVEMGKLIGARYLVTGNILEYGGQTKRFSGYGVNTKSTTYILKARLELMEIQTGRKLFSKTASSQSQAYAGGGLSVKDSTISIGLAGSVADKLVTAMLNSKRVQALAGKKEDDEQVEITISSMPQNADVEIDGVFYGNTGSSFLVTPGLHSIKVSLPGYEVWSKKVMVKSGLVFKANLTESKDQKIQLDIQNN
jgi:curli biogenesis system outer membrane secretion channel CsgG